MMKALIAFILLSIASATHASIIYDINRTIDAGSVVGSIETDGTIGTLGGSNITDFSLTLTSDNLTSPSPITLTYTTANILYSGSGFAATATNLSFDFSLPGAYIYFQLHDSVDWHVPYWGLSNNDYYVNQATGSLSGELLGWGPGGTAAEAVAYSQPQTVNVLGNGNNGQVPVPAPLALMALGLAVIGWTRRKA